MIHQTGGGSPSGSGDLWSEWLLHIRFGGEPAYGNQLEGAVNKIADRVLDFIPLTAGMTLADIGAGDGLIAFRAIERVGAGLQVVLTDISVPLLTHVEQLALKRNVHGQCRFVHCSADDLSALPDGSTDAVTTRSVLAYVADREKALGEFYRVLKPNGRIALAEPIMQDDAFAARALRLFLERTPPGKVQPIMRLLHRWKAAQFPDSDEAMRSLPLTNFGERDLVRLAHAAGFTELHMELHIDMTSSNVPSWDVFLASSPHPLAPPLNETLQKQFTPEERAEFERVMRPVIENPKTLSITRMAYLTALKPAT